MLKCRYILHDITLVKTFVFRFTVIAVIFLITRGFVNFEYDPICRVLLTIIYLIWLYLSILILNNILLNLIFVLTISASVCHIILLLNVFTLYLGDTFNNKLRSQHFYLYLQQWCKMFSVNYVFEIKFNVNSMYYLYWYMYLYYSSTYYEALFFIIMVRDKLYVHIYMSQLIRK